MPFRGVSDHQGCRAVEGVVLDEEDIVGLAEAIETIRVELVRAQQLGEGSPIRFAVEPIEFTVNVVVTKSGRADGKVGWGVIGLSASGAIESAKTHTLKLTMRPLPESEASSTGAARIAAGAQVNDPFQQTDSGGSEAQTGTSG